MADVDARIEVLATLTLGPGGIGERTGSTGILDEQHRLEVNECADLRRCGHDDIDHDRTLRRDTSSDRARAYPHGVRPSETQAVRHVPDSWSCPDQMHNSGCGSDRSRMLIR